MPLLELRGLTKYFGGLPAVNEVDLDIDAGELRGLIGPNGAGKSSLFNAVAGYFKPTRGTVVFNGEDITGLRPDIVATKGLGRTFQATVLFGWLTVWQNLVVAVHLRTQVGLLGALFTPPSTRRKVSAGERRAEELMEFFDLGEMRMLLAASLPHGHQRILGVAVALGTEPKMLMMDEPVTGMNAEETDQMMMTIRKIRDELGITVLLVEHDMRAVMGLCNNITVMDFGKKIAEGTPEQIRENPAVIEAYLGAEE